MDNNNLGRRQKADSKHEVEIAETRDQYRVVITKEANEAIGGVAALVNADFAAGEVTKSDIANYVFINLSRLLSDSDFKILRAQHFDPKRALSALLKSSDGLPEELQKTLRTLCGIGDTPKKRTLKPNSELSTTATVENPAAA